MSLLSGFKYRKSVTISRASGTVTDYQMQLLVGKSSSAVGADIDTDDHCEADFDDLRFTTSDGVTLLDYWIEEITGVGSSALARVWIEFDSIGTSATTFRMYYGNAGASAVSNGPNTFPFFDDFSGDLSKWSGETGYASIAGGILTVSGNTSNVSKLIHSATSLGSKTGAIRGRVNLQNAYTCFGHHKSHAGRFNHSGVLQIDEFDGSYNAENSNWTEDSYQVFEVRIVGNSSMKFLQNGVEVSASPLTTYPADENLYVGFTFQSAADYVGETCDWVLMRQWAATEPAWGAWGSEENLITFIPHVMMI